MKPAAFDYHRPATLDEALDLVSRYGDEARLIAGGQSLVPMMNMRLARPAHLIDLNDLADLAFIRQSDGAVDIGALTRHRDVEGSALLAEICPLLPAAARNIGHYALRQRGTLGGSLALADPAAEFPLMAVLLDAEIVARSPAGERRIAAPDYFISVFTTALEPDEIVTAVRLRALARGEGWGYRWLARRAGDFAIVHAAATLALDDAGRIARLAMALGGVGATPLRLTDLEAENHGRSPAGNWAHAVAARAAAQIEPESDTHASAAYRKELIAVLLAGALDDALGRTAGRQAA